MKNYNAKTIRNVALTGHAGSGKTSLVEAMYYLAYQADRLGKIADGNTVSDFDPEEIRRKVSVSTSLVPVEWKNTKLNMLDTPGLFDFVGGLREGIRAAGSSVIVVSGKSGLTVGAEKAFAAAQKKGIATIFFVNKLDRESADFYKVFEDLKGKFGPMVCPMVVPHVVDHKVECYVNLLEYRAYTYEDGKAKQVPIPDMGHRLEGLRTAMNEAVAETSEELMEKYFSGEEFTPDELIKGIATGVRRGEIAPVFCGSAQELEAIDQLLTGLLWLAPWAESVAGETGTDANGDPIELEVDENAPAVATVFKTVVDPFVGKLVYFKVIRGKIVPDMALLNTRTGESERLGKLFYVRGKKQEEAPYICAGDIGAVAKLVNTGTGDTLCAPSCPVTLPGVPFDLPCLSRAVNTTKKGDEEKVATGLARLAEEDPTIKVEKNTETGELILSGLGEQHLDIIVSRLKAKFGADVTLSEPEVAYRETIRRKVKVQGRHKKQSGGHGQFGDVWIEFEPWEGDELVFEEKVFGGAVPKNYFPAVEKGLQDCSKEGVLAGYPLVGLKATLYDGSYHPVDSNDMAFQTAARLAYQDGIPKAKPTILEPIGLLKVTIPDANLGDIMSDISSKRRGTVLGMNAEDGMQTVEAEVPMAEMGSYTIDLRSMTQARGSFTCEFVRYEEAPGNVQQKVIEEAKALADAE